MYKEVIALLQKEWLTEWRQKFALGGVFLYVISTVFICYLSFKRVIDPATWTALFWIIILFASVNASAKSFLQESRGRLLYYYTVCSPQAFMISRILFNLGLTLLLSLTCFFFYSLFLGSVIVNLQLFTLTVILGSIGFSSLLTMISAIAAKAGNNFTLVAILAFPILVPMLITVIKLSQNLVNSTDFSYNFKYFAILSLTDLIVVILAYILFPYLWKD